MTNSNQKDDIDAILDAALDALDDDDDEVKVEVEASQPPQLTKVSQKDSPNSTQKSEKNVTSQPTTGPVAGPPRPPSDPLHELEHILQLMQQQDDFPDLTSETVIQQQLEQLQSQILAEMASPQSNLSHNTPQPTKTKSCRDTHKKDKTVQTKATNPKESIHDAIDALVGDMNQRQQQMSEDDDTEDDMDPHDMLQQLLQSMSVPDSNDSNNNSNNTTNSPDALVESMMQQLLAKDLMYEPMKQVATAFPSWLQEKKSTLSEHEYQQRCQQYQCFQKLVHVYETDPTNTTQLMTLMQDVQEYGQPPNDIVQTIAPGLQWDDATGLPKMEASEECPIM
ncbi:peroxin-19 [Fistulifera solaris]|uniref:Peroxin-19 n=1 Tax=Fistulifera solaris TaxID=1519565 RepID=A0A1Z5JLF6_FISSO|nr:peroxin-19 [Fistulifera solaris]|eukprot:GAX14618.1 peroxin-19 [Fistulifera solaris]